MSIDRVSGAPTQYSNDIEDDREAPRAGKPAAPSRSYDDIPMRGLALRPLPVLVTVNPDAVVKDALKRIDEGVKELSRMRGPGCEAAAAAARAKIAADLKALMPHLQKLEKTLEHAAPKLGKAAWDLVKAAKDAYGIVSGLAKIAEGAESAELGVGVLLVAVGLYKVIDGTDKLLRDYPAAVASAKGAKPEIDNIRRDLAACAPHAQTLIDDVRAGGAKVKSACG